MRFVYYWFVYFAEFPDSPSALKKTLNFEMPIEVSYHDLSDNENEKSVYEARLSENFQNVSLRMNEKEGELNNVDLYNMFIWYIWNSMESMFILFECSF